SDEEFAARLKSLTGFSINEFDLPIIFSRTTLEDRLRIFSLVLNPLKDIINAGVYEDKDPAFEKNAAYIADPKTQKCLNRPQAKELLKQRINSLGISSPLADALYRIFNSEIRPNIIYNEAETQKKRAEARDAVKPIIASVMEGETIYDPTRKITPLDQERLNAYTQESKRGMSQKNKISEAVANLTICFLMMLAAALFIAVSKSSRNRKPSNIMLFSLLLLLNLALERAVINFADFGQVQIEGNSALLIASCAPIIIGPIIQVLLCTPYTGFVMSLILSLMTAIMLGHRVDFFVLLFSASLTTIFMCQKARTRTRVITGGAAFGAVLAFFWFIMGLAYDFDMRMIFEQSSAALFAGALASILALALLPVFEYIFKASSDITLLELTDYNHPLLRMLQMEAPGTYHHSLMVAQIAEQAALKIGANPLVCSVASLYHDIGKVIKPEFFAENQAQANPHDIQAPSMSALIIKAHVRDGLDLARKHKMPTIVRDAIKQHHGTSIISYFYNKAVNLVGANARQEDLLQALRDKGIDEATYRHEGEKPQSVENAILMLADSCEAASRSLKRVTQHSIEELVEKIFIGKMNDGQLDEAPITIKQIAEAKESFVFTLQNMLHSRVEYNNAPAALQKGGAPALQTPEAPKP
ncbi:MAG: HDIG domain-containing protein, partial [Opitutales bacterium]|nr:HDIG domain-containing protein [Opitutales bacterium]